jgi:hypothetical protein
MENKSRIETIRIDFDFWYDYEDYINKKEIYVQGAELESDGSEINYWKKYKNTHRQKLSVKTISSNKFDFPIKPFFGEIEDWVLIKYLAILEYEIVPIVYSFYNKGEKFGYSDSTIVKYDNKIIKSIFCYDDSGKIPILKYLEDYDNNADQKEIEVIVTTYFEKLEIEKLNEIQRQKNEEKKADSAHDSYNDTYYNDQLDMDQQGPEFWNSL